MASQLNVDTIVAESEASVTVNDALIVAEGIIVTASGVTVTAGGATITSGGLTVTAGGATITAGGLTVTAGTATFNDNVVLGASAADTITANGTMVSNLIFTDATYDIGAAAATRPRDLHLSRSAVIGTSIELGHATDTTLARSGAGDVTVEGNQLYRASGTDVPIADGGTGASSAATAATNLGLGTGDSPQFTGIELGHASDTTLTRVGAGAVAIEGVTIAKDTSGTFTATLTGITAGGTGTATWSKAGNLVIVHYPALTGTSNTTAATITGQPAALQPATAQLGLVGITQDNSATPALARIDVGTDGVVTLYINSSSATFTGSNTKGISAGLTLSYITN